MRVPDVLTAPGRPARLRAAPTAPVHGHPLPAARYRAVQVGSLERDGPAIAGLLIFFWALLFYAVAALFRSVPEKTGLDDGLFSWLGSRLRRGLFWLLGLALCLLVFAVVLLSYQLGRVMTL